MWEKIKEFIAGALTILIVCLAFGVCISVIATSAEIISRCIMSLFNLG